MGIRDWVKTAMVASAVLALSACTVHQAEEGPAPFGPSESALGLDLTVTPDTINFDGSSQASVIVSARDASGQPKGGVVVRLDTDSGVGEIGRLSARTVVTGSDGRASAIFTAPAPGPLTTGQVIVATIRATPTSSNFQTSSSRTAEIRLIPSGVILPPADTPTANFTFPTPATAGSSVTFDGSGSCAGPAVAGGGCEVSADTIASYAWSFGDGGTGSGSVVSHTYTLPGTYSVTLTVTNDRGRVSSATNSVNVIAAQAPSGDWVISPTAPNVNETVFFNADAVRASAGHSISSYNWDFGDGTTATGVRTTHVYTAARTYAVVLRVTDDTGATAVITKNVTIGSGNPNAVLSVTKTGGNDIRADGGSSSAAAGASISTYTFDFGSCNATGQSGSQSFATRTCAVGTHTIRLTVTDSAGRSSSTTQSVTLP